MVQSEGIVGTDLPESVQQPVVPQDVFNGNLVFDGGRIA